MNADDAARLAYCSIEGEGALPAQTGSSFLDSWFRFEHSLRFALAQARAAKLKWSAPADDPSVDAGAGSQAAVQAAAALALTDPLQAELALDQGRWQALDSLSGLEYFNVNTIYAYFIKLLLLERRAQFKVEEGFAAYQSLYTSIIEKGEQTP
jgi:hypothetical protein